MTNDLISRSALKKAFEDTVCISPMPYAFVKQIIDLAPTVEERPQGKWIESDVPESVLVKCSICGFNCGAITYNYCPSCGADMKEADNEDDQDAGNV